MKAIDMTANAPRSQASWFQSAVAGALGVCIGFLLGTTSLSSAPWGAVEPPPALALPAGAAATQAWTAPSAAAAVQEAAEPAQAISGGIEPCWAEVKEIVRC